MIKGLRTVLYPTPNLARAKAWYSAAFSTTPYFDESFYVGFNIGGFELGLVPDAPTGRPASGVVTYWGVDNVAAACEHFFAHGATIHEEPKDVGGGITVAAVLDPFGNIIGLIDNPAFDARAVK